MRIAKWIELTDICFNVLWDKEDREEAINYIDTKRRKEDVIRTNNTGGIQ